MFFHGNLLLIPENKAVEFPTLMRGNTHDNTHEGKATLMRARRSKGLIAMHFMGLSKISLQNSPHFIVFG